MQKSYIKYFSILALLLLSFAAKAVPVTASFHVADSTVNCVVKSMHFANTTSPTSGTTYTWNLGNGTITHVVNPTGFYNTVGTFHVTLTAYNGSDSSVTTMDVVFPPAVSISFTASDTAICPGGAITFTNTSTSIVAGAISYTWFINGVPSSVPSPTSTFNTAGYYSISLSATNHDGCSSNITFSNYVHVYTKPNITLSPSSQQVLCDSPYTATFNSTTLAAHPITYTWKFGDGSSLIDTNGHQVHVYDRALGLRFTDTIYITDAHGCKDTFRQVNAVRIDTFRPVIVHSEPICVGSNVLFINLDTLSINTSFWELSDSAFHLTLYDTVNTHYGTSGTKYIHYSGGDGSCIRQFYDTLFVHPSPDADFTITPQYPCASYVNFFLAHYDTVHFYPDTSYQSVIWSVDVGGYVFDTIAVSHGLDSAWTIYREAGIKTIKMYVTDIYGCKDTVTHKDTLRDHYISLKLYHGTQERAYCSEDTIKFYASERTSVPNFGRYPVSIAHYSWRFGDTSLHTYYSNPMLQDTSSGVTDSVPKHIYRFPGKYRVVCIVELANGCIDSTYFDVKISKPPVVSYTVAPSHVCPSQPAFFTPEVDTLVDTTYYATHVDYYDWHFVDSTHDTSLAQKAHIYPRPGVYYGDTVYAVNGNCVIRTILPDADSVTVDSGKAVMHVTANCHPGNEITFINESLGADSVLWLFGDGTTSNADSGVHAYPTTGVFTVTLTTYSSYSHCNDTARLTIHLTDNSFGGFGLYLPTMDTTVCIGDTLLYKSSVVDTFNQVSKYKWYINHTNIYNDTTYGDGRYSIFGSFNTHAGYDTITLIAVRYGGCMDTTDMYIHIGSPLVHFLSADTICNRSPVTLLDSTSVLPARTITSYIWYFGDGGSIADTNTVTHTYFHSPTIAVVSYTVTEIVTDSKGCVDSFKKPIRVLGDTAKFSVSPSNLRPCVGSPVTFTNTSVGSRLKYYWAFGDGDTSLLRNPVHTYLTRATDTVELVIIDSVFGCIDTFRKTYLRVNKPDITIHMSDTFAVCAPLDVDFYLTNTDTFSVTSVLWTLQPPSITSTVAAPHYTYWVPGDYLVSVIGTNAFGCKDTATSHARLFGFAGSFTTSVDTGCTPLAVDFSTTTDSGYSVLWDFGDGVPAMDSTTTNHVYTEPGTYIVTLYLSSGSCTNFSSDTITVFPLPVVDTIIGVTSICEGSIDLLVDATPGGIWSSSDSTIVSVTAGGNITAVSVGTAIISYTVLNSHGCASITTHAVVVHPIPAIPPITGLPKECVTGTTTLYNDTLGGIWSSIDGAIAVVDALTGVVTGIGVGTCTITYYYATEFGCSTFATITDTVITIPSALPVSGTDSICVGGTAMLTNPAGGGYWVSNTTDIATIDSFSGIVTGVTGGVADISYILPTVCGDVFSPYAVTVIDAHTEISGHNAVCSGSTLLLTDVSTGTWTSGNTVVAIVDPITGVVTGVSYGTAIITCTGTNVCGSFVDTFRVLVDPSPFITTNFIVACQSLTDGESESGIPVIVTDPDGCLMVCENTTVRYYGNGVDSGHFTWTCTGGTIIAMYGDNNDSIDVQWSTPGAGSISMTDTFSHCIGSASFCIKVVSKPHAAASASSGAVCLGNQIAFFDHSTADTLSPITSWFWDFGDGTGSPLQNPMHTYGAPGLYFVNLVVRNGCGCADTSILKIYVTDSVGPVIYCPSIVCERDRATYSIADSTACGPVWTVTGGTIISGDGTSSIEVVWNTPPTDGFGYVSVTDTCGHCSAPSIVKVPIILKTADISGPSNVCIKQPYVYSLPLWAATDYEWGVLGSPGIIIGPNNDHQITVKFPAPGYYTIHGWYNNRLKLCGGDVTKVVYVRDQAYIAGPVSACFDNTASYSYSMSGWLSATWVITDPLGSTSTYGPSTTFALTTPIPGVYTVNASGDFCTNPITMTSLDLPPAIDSMVGPDTICLNRVYTYTAYNDVPGTVYVWEALGGHVIPASGSSVVDVIWTSSGTKQLTVKHDADADPHCPAPVTVLNITQENISPIITGEDLPCANGRWQYSSGYHRADNYDWKIYPDSVGSVVTGNHSADVTVLWNNVVAPTNALLIVKVQKCDTSVSDTFHVAVQPPPIVYITTSDTAVCAGVPITFTPNNGTGSYQWDFGDGTTVTSSVPVSHLFPANTSAGNVVYNVRLTSLFDTSDYCPSTGVAFTSIAMKPSPVAFASTGDDLEWCTDDTVHLIGTVTDNVGTGLTFQWYRNGTAITGATLPDYSAINALYVGTSTFHFTVISANGCSDTSAGLTLYNTCDGAYDTSTLPPHYPPLSGCCGPSTSACGASVNGTVSCNVVTLTSTGPSTSHWHAFNQPSAASASTWDINGDCAGPNASATYDAPGIYRFAYVFISPTGCRDTLVILDTVGIAPDFQYFLRCAPGGEDSVFFVDHSVHLSWFVPTGIAWTPASITSTGAGTAVGVFATGTTPTVTETVSGTPGPFSCPVTKTLTIPARHPHFGFTFTPNNVCAGIPISFTPGSTAGIVSYFWDFGNGGTSRRQSPDCTYGWRGPLPIDPNTVLLTVIDTLGCKFDTFFNYVNIFQNRINGQMDIDTVICPNMVPFTINYIDGPTSSSSSYSWSIPDSTIVPYDDVYTTGAYTVKVYDIHGCQFMPLRSENVRVLKTPRVQIRGRLNYCAHENVSLNGDAGHGVSYMWYINNTAYAATPGISLYPDTGTYIFKLKLTMLDTLTGIYCDDIDSVTVRVSPNPDPPVITGPFEVDCRLYHLQLVAAAAEPGTFNWSNGVVGAVNDIYDGGPFRVWFTNSAGCKSSADTYVPINPSWYFQYLPSGCYDFCDQRIPLTLSGPPNVSFHSWDWAHVGVSDSMGSGIMPQYDITESGAYQWILQTGDLCPQESELMNVDIISCMDCGKTSMTIRPECSGSPACFKLHIIIADGAGGTFTIGTNNGPLDVSSGTLSAGTPLPMTLVFTAIDTDATGIVVYLEVTHPGGTKCMIALKVSLPDCSWIAEKPAGDTTTHLALIGTSLLVYPNPATQLVHISYKYGDGAYTKRSMAVFDQLGRKVAETTILDNNGNWDVNTTDLVPGMYIIRMEGDGKTLQSQRLTVSN